MPTSPLVMRKRARSLAVQSLYEWQLSANSTPDIAANALAHQRTPVDETYYREALYQIQVDVAKIDAQLTPIISRPIAEVSPVELAVLRMACYEFMHRLDVPYRVVINEALNNAKKFGAAESHRFINGALDKLAQALRSVECKRRD